MKHRISIHPIFILAGLVGLLQGPSRLYAAACSAAADGNWSAGATWTGCTGPGGIPAAGDTITIGSAMNITLDVDATISGLTFSNPGTANDLTQNAGTTLTINGPVDFTQPTTNSRINGWNINAGSAIVSGLISLNGTNTTTSRISRITITSGQLNAFGGLSFAGTTALTKQIVMSGGAGNLNLKGAITYSGNAMTLTMGTAGAVFNYADDTAPQTVRNFPSGAYFNLTLNNTGGGATLAWNETSTNVVNSLRIQSGTLNNGGRALTGAAGDTFEVADGAVFEMTGTSVFPTGYTNIILGSASTVRYLQTSNPLTLSLRNYGNLDLVPAGTASQRFPAGTLTVNGNLSIGNGTNATTADLATNSVNLTVGGNVTINASGTLTPHASNPLVVGGNWSNKGTFSAGTSTVAFISAIAQVVHNKGQNFTHLIASNTSSGGLTFSQSFSAQRLTVASAGLASGSTLYFAGGNTFTISTFVVNGTVANSVVLRSTESGTAWSLVNTVRHAVSYVDVKDSDASGGLRILDYPGGVDSGNNSNWAIGLNPPSNLSAPSISAATITGTWSPASPTPDNYVLQLGTASDFSGTLISSVTVFTSASVNPLSPNTTYYLQAASVINNTTSSWDASLTTATLANAPGTPANPWTLVLISSLTLSWQNNSNPFPGTNYVAEISTVSGFGSGTTLSSATTALQADFTNLQAGGTYYGRVRAVNHRNVPTSNTGMGSTVTLNIPVPQNLAYSTASTTSLTAAWQSSLSADSYSLQVGTASDFMGILFSSNTKLFSAVINGLSVNTTYYGRVNALISGSSSSWTAFVATATLTNTPSAVGSPWTNMQYTSFTVTWASNGNPSTTQYRAHLSTASNFIGTLTSSATVSTSVTFTQLESGSTYYIRTKAVNFSGVDSNYLVIGSTKTSASAIPSNLGFSTGTSSGLTATWSPGSNPGDTYDLQLGTSSSFTGTIYSSNTVLQTASFTGLSSNTTYYARARAILSGNPSPWSGFESTSTLAAIPVTAGSTWTNVYLSSLTFSWSANGNSSVTNYEANLSTVSNFLSGTTLSSTTLNLLASFTDLDPSSTYYARVLALNNLGIPTNYLTVGSTLTGTAIPPASPGVTSVQTNAVSASWSVSIPAGPSYTFQVSTTSNFTGSLASSTTALLTGTVPGLVANTTYYGRVLAGFSGSSSPWSSSVTTATLANVPGTAVSTWTLVSYSSVTMSWTANGNPSNTTLYRAEASDAPDFSTNLVSSTTYSLQASLDTLLTNTVYYGRVLAIGRGGTETAYANLGSTQTLSPTACNATTTGNWTTAGTWTGCTGVGGLPSATDAITINSAVVVTLNTNATIAGLTFAAPGTNNALTQSAGTSLTVNGAVTFNQPTTSSRNNSWNINTGTGSVSGLISFNGTNTTTSRISQIVVTSGQLNAFSGMTFQGTTPATKVININNAYADLNLKDQLTFAGNSATLTANANSIFNFNDDTNAQTIRNFPVGAFGNLYINNTSPSGATLGRVLTSTNVATSLRIQSGIFKNGGFATTGAAGDTFEVADGAVFEMTGTSAFPSGYATITLGSASTVRYKQTSNPLTLSLRNYGNLDLVPAGPATQRFPAGTMTVIGHLTMGDGVNAAAIDANTNSCNLTVSGNVEINSNSSFTPNNTNPLTVGGDWTNRGTFTAGSSTISFASSNAQAVDNNGQNFNTLIDSNTSAGGLSFTSAASLSQLTLDTSGLGSAATIYFAGDNIFSIANLTLRGTATEPIVIRSTEPATPYFLNNTSTHSVRYAWVRDADASGGQRILDYPGGTDGGNNSNWAFGLNAPSNFRVTGVTNNGLTTTWNIASPSADTYITEISTDSGFGGTIVSSETVNLTATTPPSLATNTTYYARIRSSINGALSSWTSSLTTSTLADLPGSAGEPWMMIAYTSATVNWLGNSNPPNTIFEVDLSTRSDFSSGNILSSHTVDTTATVIGLSPGTTYYGRVRAVNHIGIGTAYLDLGSSETLTIEIPMGLAFTSAQVAALTAAWVPQGPADSFILQVSTDSNFGGTFTSSQTVVSSATIPSSLSSNTTYYGRVAAVLNGSAGSWSTPITTATLANVPASAVTTWTAVAFTSATLAWNGNGNPTPETAYHAELSTVSNFLNGDIIKTNTAEISYGFDGLNSGATYFARVQAINHSGISTNFTNLGSTRTQASSLPVNLHFTTASVNSLTAAWSIGAQAGDSYTLNLSTADDFTGTILSSHTVLLSASISGLSVNTTYFARVRGISGGQPSPWGVSETTSTLANMPLPAASTWTAVYISSISVAWNANGNPAWTSYTIDVSTVSNFGSGITHSSETLDINALLDTLLPQATYYARVNSTNNSGIDSNYQSLGSTLTKKASSPENLTFSQVDISSASAFWDVSEPSGGVYTFQMSSNTNFAIPVASSSTIDLSGLVAGLSPNTTYFGRVNVSVQGSTSLWSAAITTVTLANQPLTAVSTWSLVNFSSFTMSWSANGNPASTLFIAEVSDLSDFSGDITSSATYSTQAGFDSLLTGTAYYGRVKAVNQAGSETAYSTLGSTQTRSPTLCNAVADGNWSSGSVWSGCTGVGGLPAATDAISINSAVNISLDMDATIAGLTFVNPGTNNDLTDSGSHLLTVNGNVSFTQPTTSSRTNAWNINAGTATVTGLISFNGSNTTTTRISKIVITSGQLNAKGGMTFAGNTVLTKQIDMAGGAGQLNLKGTLSFSGNSATLTAGTSGSVFNYNDDLSAQIVRFFPSGAYHRLYVNNTGGGATLNGNITTSNVTGDVRIQSGVLKNGGYSLTGAGGTAFEISNGGTFQLNAASDFPTGFGTVTVGTSSTIEYRQISSPYTIPSLSYGNLTMAPAGTATQQFPSGTVTVQGDLTIGDGTNAGSITVDANATTLNVNGSVLISNNSTLTANAATTLTVGDSWFNNGTFAANSSTVVFNGAGIVTISGDSTFYVLRDLTAGSTIQFLSGDTVAVSQKAEFQDLTLKSLSDGDTWYLSVTGSDRTFNNVRVQDSNASGGNFLQAANSVDLGNNTFWDFGPPDATLSLIASQGTFGATIDLDWQAPGDDGSTGTLYNSSFTIQYTSNTAFAQSASWDPLAGHPSDVYRVTLATTNLNSSVWVSTAIGSLSGGDTYYFRLWTKDDSGNYSQISNGATNYATPVILSLVLSTDTLAFGKLDPAAVVVMPTPIVVTNDGNVSATYVFRATTTAEEWPWQIGTTQGIDQFVLWMVADNSEPLDLEFGDEDRLSESDTPCTSTTFTAGAEACISVLPGEQKTFWFKIGMPPIVNTDKEQTIRVVGTPLRAQ